MIKQLLLLIGICFLLLNCDVKKIAISGKVINSATGIGISDALVSYVQCETNGDNCTEIVIGQTYTNDKGEFYFNNRSAKKSRTRWLTVFKGSRKLAKYDNVSLKDKNIVIEVLP